MLLCNLLPVIISMVVGAHCFEAHEVQLFSAIMILTLLLMLLQASATADAVVKMLKHLRIVMAVTPARAEAIHSRFPALSRCLTSVTTSEPSYDQLQQRTQSHLQAHAPDVMDNSLPPKPVDKVTFTPADSPVLSSDPSAVEAAPEAEAADEDGQQPESGSGLATGASLSPPATAASGQQHSADAADGDEPQDVQAVLDSAQEKLSGIVEDAQSDAAHPEVQPAEVQALQGHASDIRASDNVLMASAELQPAVGAGAGEPHRASGTPIARSAPVSPLQSQSRGRTPTSEAVGDAVVDGEADKQAQKKRMVKTLSAVLLQVHEHSQEIYWHLGLMSPQAQLPLSKVSTAHDL